MICKVCGEEVRVRVTLARYADVSCGVDSENAKNEDDCEPIWYWDEDQGMYEHEVESTVTCECEECPYMLFDEKVVEKKQGEISRVRRLTTHEKCGCSKCPRTATHVYQLKTSVMKAPGFYYYCDECLPEKYQAGIGTYTNEWKDI